MNRGKQAYDVFLRSDFWIALSSLKRGMVGKCERCGCKRRLECHHRFYRADWYKTQLDDLEVLCGQCHKKEHGIHPIKFTPNPRNRPKASKKRGRFHGKLSHRQRIQRQNKKLRRQGLEKRPQLKPWQHFRITPVHHYVNRGTSSN